MKDRYHSIRFFSRNLPISGKSSRAVYIIAAAAALLMAEPLSAEPPEPNHCG